MQEDTLKDERSSFKRGEGHQIILPVGSISMSMKGFLVKISQSRYVSSF